jgi:hypothetical protein
LLSSTGVKKIVDSEVVVKICPGFEGHSSNASKAMETDGLKCLLPRSKDNVRITSDMHDNDGLTLHAIQEAEWLIVENIGQNNDMKMDDGQLRTAQNSECQQRGKIL